MAAPAFASYPTHVRVSLTRIPGNICCPKYTRASVSAKGFLIQYTAERGGAWRRVGSRKLRATELRRLRAELGRFNPATLDAPPPPGCGRPVGDVGGIDLKVGRRESNCPPKSAQRLIHLLSGWLPRA